MKGLIIRLYISSVDLGACPELFCQLTGGRPASLEARASPASPPAPGIRPTRSATREARPGQDSEAWRLRAVLEAQCVRLHHCC